MGQEPGPENLAVGGNGWVVVLSAARTIRPGPLEGGAQRNLACSWNEFSAHPLAPDSVGVGTPTSGDTTQRNRIVPAPKHFKNELPSAMWVETGTEAVQRHGRPNLEQIDSGIRHLLASSY